MSFQLQKGMVMRNIRLLELATIGSAECLD